MFVDGEKIPLLFSLLTELLKNSLEKIIIKKSLDEHKLLPFPLPVFNAFPLSSSQSDDYFFLCFPSSMAWVLNHVIKRGRGEKLPPKREREGGEKIFSEESLINMIYYPFHISSSHLCILINNQLSCRLPRNLFWAWISTFQWSSWEKFSWRWGEGKKYERAVNDNFFLYQN